MAGLPTATLTKIHSSPTSKTQQLVVNYYDKYGRVIQTVSDNHLLGYDRVSIMHMNSVNSNISKTKHEHSIADATVDHTLLYEYEYDHVGRPLRTYMKVNSDDRVLLSAQKYNVLGQADQKYIHGNATTNLAIQQIDYKYNIRGWLTAINNPELSQAGDKFGMELLYDNYISSLGTASDKQYNGNIAAMKWNTSVSGGGFEGYGFQYDAMNRLTNAKYGSGSSYSYNNKYGVYNITYDENGNIKTLDRKSNSAVIDDLSYSYYSNTNKLSSVNDSGDDDEGFLDNASTSTEYTYDGNGNMVTDQNNAIASVTYNAHLNLPTAVQRTGGNIAYTYDANGTKLRNNNPNGNNVDYIANFVYKDGSLKYILTAEGRVVHESGNFSYQYFLKDHLGNTRVVLDENGSVVQANNYYPFGMNRPIQGDGTQNYLYNGKELQEGTDWYDYGARMYNPALGRFMVQDVFAEKYLSLNPYQYTGNSPVNFIDYNGDYIILYGENYMYSVLYENGIAYHYSIDEFGNIIKGDEYDGSSSAIDQAINDLIEIESTKYGNSVIDDLSNDNTITNVSFVENYSLYASYDENTNSITYGSNKVGRFDGVNMDKTHLRLGHELGHAWCQNFTFEYKYNSGDLNTYSGRKSYLKAEEGAIRFENYLRAMDGEIRMRTTKTIGGRSYSLFPGKGYNSDYFRLNPLPLTKYNEIIRIATDNSNNNVDNTYVSTPEFVIIDTRFLSW